MREAISVIIPAYRAQRHIRRAVASLLGQTYTDFEAIIIGDDEVDYHAILAAASLSDRRIVVTRSGGTGLGESRARNVGLATARSRYVTLLDADDHFATDRLERVAAALSRHPLVGGAVTIESETGLPLGTVGAGPDAMLRAAQYKWRHPSGDSVVGWDRALADVRYDEGLAYLPDLDFLMRLFCRHHGLLYLGTPSYRYVKTSGSMSNGPHAARGMVAAKTELLARIQRDEYPFVDPLAAQSFAEFLRLSLAAEETFAPARAQNPTLTFESHIEAALEGARPRYLDGP